jgi:hypothetical protein
MMNVAALRGFSFADLRIVLLLTAVAATAALMPAQADTYWHLRAGQDLFTAGHVPMVDGYSHTARGLPWPNHEWLWQALSYGLYRGGGMPLLAGAGAVFATLACAIAYRLMRARSSVNFVLALIGIPAASVVWALRPQVVSLFFLMLLVHLVAAERFRFIPLLFVLWANLHGAVALGGAVLVTATVVAWFGDRRRFPWLLGVTIVSGALTGLTPMGLGLWRFIGESMTRSRQNQIMEWLPSYPKGPIEIAFWLAALIFAGMVVRRWRRLDSWSDRVVVAVALILLPLAARAVRNISPFFLLWMPAMSRLIGPEARLPGARGPRNAAKDDGEHTGVNLALAGFGVVGAIVAVAFCWARPIDRLGWRPIAPAAVAAVRRCPGPLYNRYNEGGFLIWFVPEIPVFVDSRQDPYPADLLTAHAAAEKTGAYRDLFARHGIGCAALPPQSLVAKALVLDRWIETYRDPAWVVLSPAVAPPRQ